MTQSNNAVHLCTLPNPSMLDIPVERSDSVRVEYLPDAESSVAAFTIGTTSLFATPSGQRISSRRFDAEYPAAAVFDAMVALTPLGDVAVYLNAKTLTFSAGAQSFVVQPYGTEPVQPEPPVAEATPEPAPKPIPASPLVNRFEYTVQQTLDHAASLPSGVVLAFAVSETDQVVFHLGEYALTVTRARNGRAVKKLSYPPITLTQFMEVLCRKSARK